MENNTQSEQKEVTQTEAEIFAEMSKAVQGNDYAALDRITTDETPIGDKSEKKVEEPLVKEAYPDPAKAGEEEPKKEEEEKDERDLRISQLTEELEKQNKQVHQLRSDAGRVPALQRKLSDLEKKLQDMASKPVTAASAREDSRVLNEKLAQIKEADPLLAEAVEEAIKAAIDDLRQDTNTKLAQTQEVLKLKSDKDEEEYLDREYTKLVTAVPNAPDVFAHPLWAEWKTQIPPNLLAMATSAQADEVMVAFEQFSKFVVQRHPELAPKAPVKEEEKQPATNTVADKLAAERDKKLKTPTPGTAKAVAEHNSEPSDPEALFKLAYNQEREKYKR